MALDENEVWFLNGMEQGLLRYLPDAYRGGRLSSGRASGFRD